MLILDIFSNTSLSHITYFITIHILVYITNYVLILSFFLIYITDYAYDLPYYISKNCAGNYHHTSIK